MDNPELDFQNQLKAAITQRDSQKEVFLSGDCADIMTDINVSEQQSVISMSTIKHAYEGHSVISATTMGHQTSSPHSSRTKKGKKGVITYGVKADPIYPFYSILCECGEESSPDQMYNC